MVFSKHLPTTVDDANILVNYIEVSADELPPLPGTEATSATGADASVGNQEKPSDETGADKPAHAPSAAPQSASDSNNAQPPQPNYQPTAPTPIALIEPKVWHTAVPPFLADLDAPEHTHKFTRASAAINSAPPPPSLPMFLGRAY